MNRKQSLLLILVFAPLFKVGAEETLQNPRFRDWTEGCPKSWQTTLGAASGVGPESKLVKNKDRGVALTGDAKTKRWTLLKQSMPARPGKMARLQFHSRVLGLKREQGQRYNCYAALFFLNEKKQLVSVSRKDIQDKHWRSFTITAKTPEKATTIEAVLFLSMTGRLEWRGVTMDYLVPEQSFDLLIDEMARKFSHFKETELDWQKRAASYREKAKAAKTAQEFVTVVTPLLASLKDSHVWMVDPLGKKTYLYPNRGPLTVNFKMVVKQLESPKQLGRISLIGKTKEGYGYIAIASLHGSKDVFAKIEKAAKDLRDCPGLIVDLRANGGGQESKAQRIVSYWTDQSRVYGRSKTRSGMKNGVFIEDRKRSIYPIRGLPAYKKPIVVLIGPGCVSSGEGMAMMLRALPQAQLIGESTRGSSGNPAPLLLPNGVTVYYSRWVSMLPSGESFEGKGLSPDILARYIKGPDDLVLERARAALKKALKSQ
ncbi:MAG: S41 family peptidase [Planctomycetota bacterium]|nr:S41 family peptidase [Planctomycetota bacterium]